MEGRSPILLLPRTTSAPAAQSSPHLSSSGSGSGSAQLARRLAAWLPCSSSRIQERDRGGWCAPVLLT
ncbi:hypothetical protein PAHAL_1G418300 [Panicum hallii]|uniref:Uncharacterized protein n=1 Tax=Panicum hallii TaxID=206008 RepID=A0A2T8KY01_9POAL|nr:hypothetical protein PAHAL_1G418300 [Panicum hallii]